MCLHKLKRVRADLKLVCSGNTLNKICIIAMKHKNNVKISKYSLHHVIGITESTFFSLRELYAHLIII